MKRVCVFLGSSFGSKESYLLETKKLGAALAKNNITLVYGGTNRGLMGTLANSVLEHGGEVLGIIPRCLINKQHAHSNLTEMISTESMSDRKILLKNLADAFIILPGGVGTLDELFEVLTENKIGLHNKPVGILNIDNFYDPMFTFLNNMADAEFFSNEKIKDMIISTQSDDLIAKLSQVSQANSLLKIDEPKTQSINVKLENSHLKTTATTILEKTLSLRTKFLINCTTFASLSTLPIPLF